MQPSTSSEAAHLRFSRAMLLLTQSVLPHNARLFFQFFLSFPTPCFISFFDAFRYYSRLHIMARLALHCDLGLASGLGIATYRRPSHFIFECYLNGMPGAPYRFTRAEILRVILGLAIALEPSCSLWSDVAWMSEQGFKIVNICLIPGSVVAVLLRSIGTRFLNFPCFCFRLFLVLALLVDSPVGVSFWGGNRGRGTRW
jgi:hypothetical protein